MNPALDIIERRLEELFGGGIPIVAVRIGLHLAFDLALTGKASVMTRLEIIALLDDGLRDAGLVGA